MKKLNKILAVVLSLVLVVGAIGFLPSNKTAAATEVTSTFNLTDVTDQYGTKYKLNIQDLANAAGAFNTGDVYGLAVTLEGQANISDANGAIIVNSGAQNWDQKEWGGDKPLAFALEGTTKGVITDLYETPIYTAASGWGELLIQLYWASNPVAITKIDYLAQDGSVLASSVAPAPAPTFDMPADAVEYTIFSGEQAINDWGTNWALPSFDWDRVEGNAQLIVYGEAIGDVTFHVVDSSWNKYPDKEGLSFSGSSKVINLPAIEVSKAVSDGIGLQGVGLKVTSVVVKAALAAPVTGVAIWEGDHTVSWSVDDAPVIINHADERLAGARPGDKLKFTIDTVADAGYYMFTLEYQDMVGLATGAKETVDGDGARGDLHPNFGDTRAELVLTQAIIDRLMAEDIYSRGNGVILKKIEFVSSGVATGSIAYELNGGSWASGFSASDFYQEGVGATLPDATKVKKTSAMFDGWYDNADFAGDPVTGIGADATGNKIFYAKWTQLEEDIFWQGTLVNGWSLSKVIDPENPILATLKDNDKIIFEVEGSDQYGSLIGFVNGSWEGIQTGKSEVNSGDGLRGDISVGLGKRTVALIINDEVLARLRTHGVNIIGQNVTITKIYAYHAPVYDLEHYVGPVYIPAPEVEEEIFEIPEFVTPSGDPTVIRQGYTTTAISPVSDEVLEAIVKSDSMSTISVDVSDSKTLGATIDKKTASKISKVLNDEENKVDTLEIKTATGAIKVDGKALDTIVSAAGKNDDIKIAVKAMDASAMQELTAIQQDYISDVDSLAAIDASVIVGDKEIHDLKGGAVTLSVEYPLAKNVDLKKVSLVHMVDDGDAETIGWTVVKRDGKKYVEFEADSLSYFTFTYDEEEDVVDDVTYRANSVALNSDLFVGQNGDEVVVSWGKVDSAEGYVVYATYSGRDFKTPAAFVKGANKTEVSLKEICGAAYDDKEVVKVFVYAYDTFNGQERPLGCSLTVHHVGLDNAKYTNPSEIELAATELTINKRDVKEINASVVAPTDGKKLLPGSYSPELRYMSSNPDIASCNSIGDITAKKRGTCDILVITKNGNTQKVTVTVK